MFTKSELLTYIGGHARLSHPSLDRVLVCSQLDHVLKQLGVAGLVRQPFAFVSVLASSCSYHPCFESVRSDKYRRGSPATDADAANTTCNSLLLVHLSFK